MIDMVINIIRYGHDIIIGHTRGGINSYIVVGLYDSDRARIVVVCALIDQKRDRSGHFCVGTYHMGV